MPNHQYSILMVDDSRANLSILGAMFEDDGFRVYKSSSVEEAQQQLKDLGGEIDLVLSDIQMPRLSGFDLVKWMKAEKSDLRDMPILLITSQLPDAESRIHGLSLGAVDYLLRSLDPKELVIRVTHAIESYNQMRDLRQSLETTERVASTGRLFAASNHEIKNVAQIIKMSAGFLERELDPAKIETSETCQQALKMLQQSSQLLSEVTKMIGGIVSDGNLALGPVDIDATLDHIVSMTKPLLRGVQLEYASRESLWVQGSVTLIKQILINLILNARDAIEEGKPERGKIALQVDSEAGNQVVVSVIDNGVGLQVAESRSVFKPFSSTKQLRGGTGLGLWLSSHLATKMGATLTLSSNGPGLGAKAKIVLQKALPC